MRNALVMVGWVALISGCATDSAKLVREPVPNEAAAARGGGEADPAAAKGESPEERLGKLATQASFHALNRGAGEIRLLLQDDLIFAFGSSELNGEGVGRLRKMANILARMPIAKVRIESFTDFSGRRDQNILYTQAKAEAISRALRAQGLAFERIEAVGRGESFPVVSNEDLLLRGLNRRTVIRVWLTPRS